ncbi:MAG TPA: PKD domain-containing protein [Chitinophagaceae bacterium]
MKFLRLLFLQAFVLCLFFSAGAQTDTYILNGSATQNSCNCYTLTTTSPKPQSGSVWNANKIDLEKSFDFIFNIFLGCQDTGADGIVYILQPISTSVGASGEGMGFSGVVPSIGIALDTWQNFNLNDPAYDHISIQKNGNVNHSGDLAGPVPISATSNDVEDCQWHTLRISWEPSSQWLKVFFDGVKRVETQVDLIGSIFNNDPKVYWGFTGATGGSVNLQKFCTALNPNFSTNLDDNGSCANIPIQFADSSESFAPVSHYYWEFGDGTTSNQKNPPPHVYAQPGEYKIRMALTALDGCESDTSLRILTIGSVPEAGFTINDACFKSKPSLNLSAVNYGSSYQWQLDGTTISTEEKPSLTSLPDGSHSLQRTVTSLYNCGNPSTETKSFIIKPIPQVSITGSDGCVNEAVLFSSNQLDNKTSIVKWQWEFGEGTISNMQQTQRVFATAGTKNISLFAQADNGCVSDTVRTALLINQLFLSGTNDTTIFKNDPVQIAVDAVYTGPSQSLLYNWSPATGLSDPTISMPVTNLQDDQSYFITVKTNEGCVAKDTINISIFKGSAIYMPTAFTPDGNGLNDILRPKYIGIKKLDYFIIYNRWGNKVFESKELLKGWDGTSNGRQLANDVYVWVLQATDLEGKQYHLKGTVTIIR